MKFWFGVFWVLMGWLIQAQVITNPQDDSRAINDSLQELSKREAANDSLEIHEPVIFDYKFWREDDLEPTIIDTALTIESFYKQNFLQKDLFCKMPFPNPGQTFNPLQVEIQNPRIQLLPTGKSLNYLYSEDIRYYDVKTPSTEFVYENGWREGQYLSTTFTHNLTPQLNYSVRYRGLRSVGRYKNQLTSNNALIATLSYHSQNERLKIWSHYASQNLDNEENGGIFDLNEFVKDDSLRTTNRQNIHVNLDYADSEFDSRRIHVGASYALFGKSKSDSTDLQTPILLKNVFTYEKQKYLYRESQPEDYYMSPVLSNFERKNRKHFETLENTSSLQFRWGDRLLLEAGLRYENLKLYSREIIRQGLLNIPGNVEENLLGGVGKLYFDWNDKIKLRADAAFSSGEWIKSQYHINGDIDIQPIDGYHVQGGFGFQSSLPSLNLVYNQSFYKDFNYYNYSFQNTNTRNLFGRLNLEKLKTNFEAELINIDQYVYVNEEFRPKQLDGNISYFRIKGENLLSYKTFHLKSTVQYQQVTQNEEYLPLPDLIARASLYWQNKMFQDKAEVQIGINGNYFSEFESREFFPVINEFMLQRYNSSYGIQKIGGFPLFDFFLNIKVDRMRIYLRADHINALWGENNYFSAPNVPYRDFKIQMGVTWYLFT